eukprot:gene7890-biopygen19596
MPGPPYEHRPASAGETALPGIPGTPGGPAASARLQGSYTSAHGSYVSTGQPPPAKSRSAVIPGTRMGGPRMRGPGPGL